MFVLINRGDALFVKGDIPHCRCANMITNTHYWIHVYVEKKEVIREGKRKGINKETNVKNIVIVDDEFPNPPVCCWGEQRWMN